jgi:hypothetical protein
MLPVLPSSQPFIHVFSLSLSNCFSYYQSLDEEQQGWQNRKDTVDDPISLRSCAHDFSYVSPHSSLWQLSHFSYRSLIYYASYFITFLFPSCFSQTPKFTFLPQRNTSKNIFYSTWKFEKRIPLARFRKIFSK